MPPTAELLHADCCRDVCTCRSCAHWSAVPRPAHKVRKALPKCAAGERDNDDFLLHYGFVPPGNPHDSVLLFPSLGAALEWYFDRAAPQV